MGRWGGGSYQGPKDTWRGKPVSLQMQDMGKDTWVPEEWTSPKKSESVVQSEVPEPALEQISIEDMLGNAFERAGVNDGSNAAKNIEIEKE